MKNLFLFFLLCLSLQSQSNTYYASPTGTGNGSFSAPFGLQMALQFTGYKPGDSLLLREGTYKGLFTSSLTGTIEKPIIVKPYNHERVIIDGSLAGQTFKNKAAFTINGAYTWYMDLEIMNSDPERIISASGSNPIERRGEGAYIVAPGSKIINCIIHDTGQGLSWWKPATESELYGNIVYNNGWYAPDREHGHGIYSQNDVGLKTASNNIIFNNFGWGFHVYGSDQASLKNYMLVNNILFNDHNLIGGGSMLENITLASNKIYGDRIELGYGNEPNRALRLFDNYMPNGALIKYWTDVQASGNTFFYKSLYSCALNFIFAGNPDFSTFKFDNNKYYWSDPGPGYPAGLPFCWKNDAIGQQAEGNYPLVQWRSMGQDHNAIVTNMPMKSSTEFSLTGKKIFVDRNKYDAARATVTIYNWDKSNTVTVDLDSIFSPGDSYELHNVQNYFGDVITGSYNGKLTIPMTGRTVAKPIGYASEIEPSTFPEFGCFVIIKTAGTVTPPPPVAPIIIQPVQPSRVILHDTIYVHDTVPCSGSIQPGMQCNYLPVAFAGNDTTATAGVNLILKGRGSDKDGTIIKYLWTQISGPTAYNPNPNNQTVTITPWTAGIYIFRLTVTDDKNAVGTDDIKVTVK